MMPILVTFTFESLFPLLLGLALVFHVLALSLQSRAKKASDESDKTTVRINSLRSLGNTMLILAVTALVAFKALHLKTIPLHSYGLLLAVAFLGSIALAQRRAALEGISPRDIGHLSIGLILAALVGSRLFYLVFEVPPSSLMDIFAVWNGGLVIYGGIICATATVWYMMYRKKMPVGRTFDVFSAPLALGIFFGRIGCFLAGCCYGYATEGACGMVFPPKAQVYSKLHAIVSRPNEMPESFERIPKTFVPDISARQFGDVTVHPTQLYESLSMLVCFVLVMLLYKKKKFAGEAFLWVLGFYALVRFVIESVRIDTPHDLFLGTFSLSQTISLIGLPLILATIIIGRTRARHHLGN